MPLWIFLLIAAAAVAVILAPWLKRTAQAWIYQRRDAQHVTGHATAGFGPPDTAFRGSMSYYDEHPERAGHFPPPGEWNRANAATGADWDHRTAFYNGHTFGCLVPDIDHLGACPEEGDWDDGRDWPGPEMPYLPAPEPVDQGPSVVDAALALAADHPEDAGWTDQLLAELHHAPTVLDGVGGVVPMIATNAPTGLDSGPSYPYDWYDDAVEGAERLADTGEIELASLRAEYAAELRAQDDDAAQFISQKVTEAAGLRLHLHGLA